MPKRLLATAGVTLAQIEAEIVEGEAALANGLKGSDDSFFHNYLCTFAIHKIGTVGLANLLEVPPFTEAHKAAQAKSAKTTQSFEGKGVKKIGPLNLAGLVTINAELNKSPAGAFAENFLLLITSPDSNHYELALSFSGHGKQDTTTNLKSGRYFLEVQALTSWRLTVSSGE